MSVLVSGVLKITARNGRNGVFNVGELCTDLAVFKIKQAILEQFEEGEYPGEFMIAQIFQSSFIHKGRAFTDICANLVGLDIFAANLAVPKPLDPMDEQEEAAIQGSVAQEPILERPIVAMGSGTGSSSRQAPASMLDSAHHETEAVIPAQDSDEIPMVGSLDALKALIEKHTTLIRLDTTLDRSLLTQMPPLLKQRGYCFNAQTQLWTQVCVMG